MLELLASMILKLEKMLEIVSIKIFKKLLLYARPVSLL